jgi:hypothetical protein
MAAWRSWEDETDRLLVIVDKIRAERIKLPWDDPRTDIGREIRVVMARSMAAWAKARGYRDAEKRYGGSSDAH